MLRDRREVISRYCSMDTPINAAWMTNNSAMSYRSSLKNYGTRIITLVLEWIKVWNRSKYWNRLNVNSSRLRRYGVAVLAVAISLLLRLLLTPLLAEQAPFLLFFIAVIFSAWYGGRGPALLTIALSAVFGDLFFVAPTYLHHPKQLGEFLQLTLFVAASGTAAFLLTALQAAKRRAEISTQNAERHYQRLRESEERFRLLVEGVQDYAIFMLDRIGRVTSWNIGAERILGYSESEIMGRSFSCIYMAEDLANNRPAFALQHAIEHGHTQDDRWHVRKDGSLFWANGVITALRDEANHLQGFSKILRDNTERKRAEEERVKLLIREQAARAEAEAASRSKDEFLSIVSHELRTPLAAILLWAELLRAGGLDDATISQALETIERNAKSQSKLIEDLLDISRIITGNLRLNLQLVELAPIVQAAVDTLSLTAEVKELNLQLDLDSKIGLVMGDSQRLQQVISNLLSNAIKFTPSGGQIHIQLERRGNQAAIVITDTGCGISAAFLPYVFERFRQANSSPTRIGGGLGLGLAIVRHLVELHQGTVQAASLGEGQGATFTVLLPIAVFANESRPNHDDDSNEEKRFDRLPRLDGVGILLVEDEADMRDVIALVLNLHGARVISVASAGEAFAVITEAMQPPDVLVCDIGLPDEDGYTLLRRVRTWETARGLQIPAVALTAYAREEERIQALLAGFQIHIPKPLKPSELVNAIASLVEQSGLPSS